MATIPVNCPVTQEYGNDPAYYSQFNLILRNGSRGHEGKDFGCPPGTPVHAATNGVIRYADWLGNYGYYIGLQNYDGSGTGYAHLSSFAVAVGQTVTEGQIIGYTGNTGNSSGPHLHFNYYRQYGVWIYDNPNELLNQGGNIDPDTKNYAIDGRYYLYFNRPADEGALKAYADKSIPYLEADLKKSPERRAQVNKAFQRNFGRDATDEEAKKYYNYPLATIYYELAQQKPAVNKDQVIQYLTNNLK